MTQSPNHSILSRSLQKEEGGSKAALKFISTPKSHHHLRAVHVNGIAFHFASHGNVMAYVILERIRVVDGQDLLVLVGHDDHLRAGCQTLFGAGLSLIVRTLGAAFVVADPSVDGHALSHVVKRERRQGEHEGYRKQEHQNFSHGRFSPFEKSDCGPTPRIPE